MKARGRSDIRHLGVALIPPPPGRHTHTQACTHTHPRSNADTYTHMYAHTHTGREQRIQTCGEKNTHIHICVDITNIMHMRTHTHTVKSPFRWLVIGPYLGDWYFSLPLPMSSKQVHMARIKGVAGCMLLLYCQPLLLIRKQDHRQY